MRKIRLGIVLVALLTLATGVSAQEKTDSLTMGRWAIGAQISTYGPGLQVAYRISPQLAVRASGSFLSYTLDMDIDLGEQAMSSSNKLMAHAWSVKLDYHPVSFIYLTGGVFINASYIESFMTPKESVTFGKVEVSPEALGDMTVNLKPQMLNPYVGLGFGRNVPRYSKWATSLELGVVYQGSPIVDLEASGMIAPTAAPDQAAVLEGNIADFKFFPYVMFQVSYRIQ